MNTADFSVLSDELVVTLNPLRRGAYRARAVCARLAGLALPWNTASSNAEPRQRSRPGTSPARWPFPPAPAEEGTLVDQGATLPASANIPTPASIPAGRPTAEPVLARASASALASPVTTAFAPALDPASARALAPAFAPAVAAPAPRERSLGNATVEPVSSQVTMKAMVLDVVMVLAWGAIIPGLMWLGAAAGF